MFYRPLLANGKEAPLPWEVRMFFLGVDWPPSDQVSLRTRICKQAMVVGAFITFVLINEAEFLYLVQNRRNLGLALECMATYLILNEANLRVFNMVYAAASFKELLRKFYSNIYVESATDAKMFRKIQRNLRATKICSYFYIMTLFSLWAKTINGFFNNMRVLPYKMVFHYDHTPLAIFVPTLLVTMWEGVVVITHLVGEQNMLATMILHLNAGYLYLQRDLRQLHAKLARSTRPHEVLPVFRRHLVEFLERNAQLNDFAAELQAQYSVRIFIMMALSAVLLCVLGFKAATLGVSTANITYITWIAGKIVELLVFGELGSRLIKTTNEMSSVYYQSNWENVILASGDTQANVEIMKLIHMAIELNQQTFYLSGLNFFGVSLQTVVKILRGAGSYFTCLYAFR